MNKLLMAFFFSAMHTLCAAEPLTLAQARSLPRAQVVASLPDSHPAVLYAYASRLFEQGARDEAVMWFYAGQLRFRFHLRAHPELPRDGEPALMASLNATVGQSLNEWAGGSPRGWAHAIDRALAWDSGHGNATTPKDRYHRALDETRKGLLGLRDQILSDKEQIAAQRTVRGLENR